MKGSRFISLGILASLAAASTASACTVTIGSVMALTGSLGALGQQIAEGAKLAVHDINAGGGVNGCTLKMVLYDDQTQPSVGVDAAKKLVSVYHVPVIVVALASGITLPILTSVTAPAGVVLISPASTSPTFTKLAANGTTRGYWFRTVPSDALQGVAMAQLAKSKGYKRVAVLYLNNAYGVGLSGQFKNAFTKLGGTVTSFVSYDPGQSSYTAEVTQAMANHPDGLFLIGYPGDGTTVAREWISAGGPQHFLFPDGLQSQQFVNDVGPQYLKEVWGTAPGSELTPSLNTFQQEFKAKYGSYPVQAYMTNAYDAVMTVALAMDAGHGSSGLVVKNNLRKVTGLTGFPVYAGASQYHHALSLLAAGKKIYYIGAAGTYTFNRYGDTNAPMVEWTVRGGKVTNVGQISVATILGIIKKLQ